MKFLLLFILTIFSFASNEVHAQNRENELQAVETVKSFYRFHFSHESIFNEKQVSLRRRFFTPKLQRLFAAELKREKLYLKKYPNNKPFFGDGLPFEPIEFCQDDYSIGAARQTGRNMFVKVNFIYSKSSCDAQDGARISYEISLSEIAGKWLIDDVIYDDGSTLAEAFDTAQKIK